MTADVETFKKLYLQEFGVALTDSEAERLSTNLKRIYIAVYGSPIISKIYHEQRIDPAR